MNRTVALIVAVLLAALSPAQAETPEEQGLRIATEADAYDAGFGNYTAEGTMILRNKQGQESRRAFVGRVLEVEGDGDKSINLFKRPPDVQGTALLTYSHATGDDDQWLYLPALKRVKRISSSNKSGSYVGSEFSYEDLTAPEVAKYSYKFLRDEPCPGAEDLTCYVSERFPKDASSGYTRQIVWQEHETYRPYKVDFFDRKNAFLKTLTYDGYEVFLDKHWRPGKMVMVNHQTGKSTDMIWENYQFKTGLTDSDFKPARLSRLR